MIHHGSAISGFEPIIRTQTPADENGKAQFSIGVAYENHISGYWTVSDLLALSGAFQHLALSLLEELQALDHPSLVSGAGIPPAVGMDLEV